MSLGAIANPILVDFGSIERQRRWTVLLRLLLAIPQLFVIGFVGIGAFFVLIYNWFAALVLGRAPERSAQFYVSYLRWSIRLSGYLYLLTDAYPPLDGKDVASYPIHLDANPGPLNRLAVFFRAPLLLPAALFASFLGVGLAIFLPVTWILTLVRGSVPRPLFEATAATLRYNARAAGYVGLLSAEWPWGSFGDRTPEPVAPDVVVGWPPAPMPVVVEPSGSGEDGAMRDGVTQPRSEIDRDPWIIPYAPEEPAPAPPAASAMWSLVTGGGAKALLSIWLVLGIAYYGVLVAIPTFITVTSLNIATLDSTSQAIQTLNGTLTTTNARAASCGTLVSTQRLGCLTTVLALQAKAFSGLRSSLKRISFPVAVAAQASAMESSAGKSATLYRALSKVTSLAQLQALAQSQGTVAVTLQTQFNNQYQQLKTILLGAA